MVLWELVFSLIKVYAVIHSTVRETLLGSLVRGEGLRFFGCGAFLSSCCFFASCMHPLYLLALFFLAFS